MPEKTRGESGGGKELAKHVLVPVTAALTSAAVKYGIREVPKLVEAHVVPKLRDQGKPKDLAEDVVRRTRELVGSRAPAGTSSKRTSAGGSRQQRSRLSTAQRERARDERAARRRQRKTKK
jgi:hypothetical protein